jgi:hypothetical protein
MTISVVLMGGLGNQMFQYATAYALARRHDGRLSVDLSQYHGLNSYQQFELWRFSELGLSPIQLPLAMVRRGLYRLGLSSHIKPSFGMDGLGYDERVINLPDGSNIMGWFQSERYFLDASGDIKAKFDLDPFLPQGGREAMERLRQVGAVAAVHVRRGDYVGSSLFDIPMVAYYRTAMDTLSHRRNCLFLLFSDDSEWCKAQPLFQSEHIKFFVDLKLPCSVALNEMAMMSICECQIIANSTFSWWAAWLNKHSNKIIIMPKQWLSQLSADVCGLSVPGWVQI